MASAMAQAGGLAGLGELGTEMGRQRRDDTPWDLWRVDQSRSVDSPNSGTENRNKFSQSTKLMRGPILIAAIRRGWILQTHQQSGWKCGCSKLPKPS